MSKTTFFGQEATMREDMPIIDSSVKRRDFINNFPEYFNNVVGSNPEIADLEFIKRLRIIRANQNTPVDTVVFKNVGQLSPTLRERYMRDWEACYTWVQKLKNLLLIYSGIVITGMDLHWSKHFYSSSTCCCKTSYSRVH